MVKEVMIGPKEGGADFAVADLSITSTRAKMVQFSMPWMTLGNIEIYNAKAIHIIVLQILAYYKIKQYMVLLNLFVFFRYFYCLRSSSESTSKLNFISAAIFW